jgi:hypothetical protein
MRLPLTLRLAYHGFRSGMTGLLIALFGWLAFVPATPQERAALGAGIGVERPIGLPQMRMARALVYFAPDRAARMMSDASNGQISPQLAGMLLRDLAAGPVQQREAFERVVNAPEGGQTSAREAGGAKFVRTDN